MCGGRLHREKCASDFALEVTLGSYSFGSNGGLIVDSFAVSILDDRRGVNRACLRWAPPLGTH